MSGTVWVIGSGAREHALAQKISESPQVAHIAVVPGNDGMPEQWQRIPLGSGQAGFEALAEAALRAGVDLIVVGPDNPLADGIVDVLSARGILCFGPKKAAAQIEASKAFAKEIMVA